MSFYKDNKWLIAFKRVLPIYLITHVILSIITLFSFLFSSIGEFSLNRLPLRTMLAVWLRWDTQHYMTIARYGYGKAWRTAFFPLFPICERIGMFFTHDPFIAGLLVANLVGLIMLVVLYQLVAEDFDHERARRAVLYLSFFPSAFFLAAAYTESLFLCLVLLCFSQIRHQRWWLGGLFGMLACLTRSAGIFLAFPFAYEYLRQHDFFWRKIRFDILSIMLIPAGLGIYCLYCYKKFNNPLAWAKAQQLWNHSFRWPWDTLYVTLKSLVYGPGLLSFATLHNLLDLTPILFILIMIILMFVGPWRLPKDHLFYACYAIPLFIFIISFPIIIGYAPIPLQSGPRYVLEIFPAFLIVSNIGKQRLFHEAYLLICGSLFFIMCLLFLTGHWMI